MVAPEKWVTAETKVKEEHFTGILRMHLNICRGIYSRHQRRGLYLYADCHAGPGALEHKGEAFDGSPLVARGLLGASGLDYEAIHFENDPAVAASLAEHLLTPAAVADAWPWNGHKILAEDCETGLPRWCHEAGLYRQRHGLIYSDPIDDPIPVDALNAAADYFPKVDLLAYVAANDQYKRANGSGRGHGRTLAEDIAAVKKKVALIRKPRTAHQWTFILWSNWVDFPQWERIGFVRIDSPRGREYLEVANWTKKQIRERSNTPLPLEIM